MTGILLTLLLFAAQPQELPQENQRQIERLQDRMDTFQRQLDRIERNTERLANDGGLSDYLLYLIMALLGLDKGSYWIARRRNGNNRLRTGEGSLKQRR